MFSLVSSFYFHSLYDSSHSFISFPYQGHENATAENGPWVITLDAPSYMPVMQHARNRSLREEVYRAYVTRASSGDLDNTPIIDQILKLRLEKAKLLQYNNYAEVSLYVVILGCSPNFGRHAIWGILYLNFVVQTTFFMVCACVHACMCWGCFSLTSS